ncbi:MAG: hypothetical protein M1825_001521 [Sarcosagium campestre]|nr:MAG: hypothetical protein M1825_001521 [Sarcosagium campestre]
MKISIFTKIYYAILCALVHLQLRGLCDAREENLHAGIWVQDDCNEHDKHIATVAIRGVESLALAANNLLEAQIDQGFGDDELNLALNGYQAPLRYFFGYINPIRKRNMQALYEKVLRASRGEGPGIRLFCENATDAVTVGCPGRPVPDRRERASNSWTVAALNSEQDSIFKGQYRNRTDADAIGDVKLCGAFSELPTNVAPCRVGPPPVLGSLFGLDINRGDRYAGVQTSAMTLLSHVLQVIAADVHMKDRFNNPEMCHNLTSYAAPFAYSPFTNSWNFAWLASWAWDLGYGMGPARVCPENFRPWNPPYLYS